MFSGSGSSGGASDSNIGLNVTECSPDFYLDDSSGLCRPECGEFFQLSDQTAAWLHPLIIVTLIIQILGGVLLLVVSCINYKQM